MKGLILTRNEHSDHMPSSDGGGAHWVVHAFLRLLPLLFFLTAVGSAHAAPQACPERPEDERLAKKQAGEWFDRATGFVLAEAYREALQAFQCSLSLVPHPATLFNTAKAAEEANETTLARDLYRQYTETYPDGEKVGVAKESVARLDGLLTDEVPTPLSAATAPDDGAETGDAIGGNPGAPANAIGPPRNTRIQVTQRTPLRMPRTGVPTGNRTLKMVGIGMLASGAVGVVVGTVFQTLTARAYYDGRNATRKEAFEPALEETRYYQPKATIAFAVGGTALVGGLVLYLVGRRAKPKKESAKGAFNAGSPGLAVAF